ncbi:MAG: hypothetical protein JXA15_11450 [Spirochaetales bacterium]|nr:hypothetical protein [Spirochaetales bacterium]
MSKRIASLVALSLALSLAAWAHTVGVVLVEEDLPVLALADSALASEALSTGALDALFDAGQIAVGSPVLRAPRAAWIDPAFALKDAREGWVDFLVLLFVSYRQGEPRETPAIPGTLSWRLVRVADGAVLESGSVAGPPDSPDLVAKLADSSRALGAVAAKGCIAKLDPFRTPGGKP